MLNFKNFMPVSMKTAALVIALSGVGITGCGKAPISGTFVGTEKLTMNQSMVTTTTTTGTGAASATTNAYSTYLTINEGKDSAITGSWISSGSGTYNITGTAGTDRIDNVSMTLDGASNTSQTASGAYGSYGSGYGSYGNGYNGYGYNAYSNCTYQGTLFLDKDTLKGNLIANSQYCPALQRTIEAKRSQSN